METNCTGNLGRKTAIEKTILRFLGSRDFSHSLDRFQKQDELFRKHVRRLADGRFFGSVAAGGL
jgi:hypothetical protein